MYENYHNSSQQQSENSQYSKKATPLPVLKPEFVSSRKFTGPSRQSNVSYSPDTIKRRAPVSSKDRNLMLLQRVKELINRSHDQQQSNLNVKEWAQCHTPKKPSMSSTLSTPTKRSNKKSINGDEIQIGETYVVEMFEESPAEGCKRRITTKCRI